MRSYYTQLLYTHIHHHERTDLKQVSLVVEKGHPLYSSLKAHNKLDSCGVEDAEPNVLFWQKVSTCLNNDFECFMVCYKIKLLEPIQVEVEAFTRLDQRQCLFLSFAVMALHLTQTATDVADFLFIKHVQATCFGEFTDCIPRQALTIACFGYD